MDRFAPPAVLAAALATLAAGSAGAVTLDWLSAVSGNAGTAARWSPAQVPASGDLVRFAVAGSYTVTFDGTVPVNTTQIHRSGTVTLVATNHTVSGTFRVGDSAGDAATVRFTTGDLSTGSTVILGNASTSQGTLEVDDDDANLVQSGTAADVVVGSSGQGTLRVTGGGFVDAADDVVAGSATGSQGTVVVSGVNASPVVRSGLFSSGIDGDLVFGSNGGATVSIAAGAQAVADDDVRIAVGSASVANVTVEGVSTPFAAELRAFGDLDLAQNGVAGASGTGSLLVQSQGAVIVAGTTRVGDADGGTGTLRMRGQSSLSTHDLLFNDAHGVLDWQGGTIAVNGGVCDLPGSVLVLDDLQFELLRLTGGATATFDGGSAAGYALIAGESKEGGFRLETGAHATQVRGVLSVGLAPGSHGVVDVTGGSLLDGTGTIVIGQGGYGELNVGSGADVSLTELSAAYSPGSNAFVDLNGPGTTVTLTRLLVGGSASTAGGTAFVGVGDSALVTFIGGDSAPVRVHPGGLLFVTSGGRVVAPSNVNDFGRIALAGGRIETASLNLQPGGRLEGNGTIAGNVAASSTTNVIHASGGQLTLGNTASNKGFSSEGTLECASKVVLLDSDISLLGNVVLMGGDLDLPTGGGSVQAGKQLSGSGTVKGNLIVAGTLSPGASAGQLVVQGACSLAPGSRLVMDIGDAPAVQDLLQSTSIVTTAGALDVHLLPGFVPSAGEEFTLITCASRSGTFSSVTYEGNPVSGRFTILYNPTSVVLHVNGFVDAPGEPALPRAVSFVGRSVPGGDARFELALPEAARVVVRLHDSAGRRVATLADADFPAGTHVLRPGIALPGGVYFGRATVRTAAARTVRTAKVAVVP